MEEFDIRESFEAMDENMTGEISFDAFFTLYLGLGYPKATKKELRQLLNCAQGEASKVTLATVLHLLSQVCEQIIKLEMSGCSSHFHEKEIT